MDKLSSNMLRTVQEMLRTSKDISISTIPPIASAREFLKFLSNLKTIVSKNKGKTLTIIVSIN